MPPSGGAWVGGPVHPGTTPRTCLVMCAIYSIRRWSPIKKCQDKLMLKCFLMYETIKDKFIYNDFLLGACFLKLYYNSKNSTIKNCWKKTCYRTTIRGLPTKINLFFILFFAVINSLRLKTMFKYLLLSLIFFGLPCKV